MVKVKEDLTGVKFDRLTVLYQIEDYVSLKGKHHAQWLCECDCEEHKQIAVRQSNLRSGNTTSCGCLSREHTIELNYDKHKMNKYDLSGEYGIGWTSNTNIEFYFDLEDYDKIKDYCWHDYISSSGYHMLTASEPNTNKNILMTHVLGYKWHDHIDRNPLNNRKVNLRPCTASQNNMNQSKQSNNTSGFIGVSWSKQYKKWVSYININKKTTYLGRFVSKADAIKTRLQAESEYYGEFAPQRHLFKEYEIEVISNN